MQVKPHFIIKLCASAVRLIHQAGSLHPEVSFIIGAASALISASGTGSLTCFLTHCQSVLHQGGAVIVNFQTGHFCHLSSDLDVLMRGPMFAWQLYADLHYVSRIS